MGRDVLVVEDEPLRDEDPSDLLDHATSEITSGSKLGIDATKKLSGEGFKRPWPPLTKMDAAVRRKIGELLSQAGV